MKTIGMFLPHAACTQTVPTWKISLTSPICWLISAMPRVALVDQRLVVADLVVHLPQLHPLLLLARCVQPYRV